MSEVDVPTAKDVKQVVQRRKLDVDSEQPQSPVEEAVDQVMASQPIVDWGDKPWAIEATEMWDEADKEGREQISTALLEASGDKGSCVVCSNKLESSNQTHGRTMLDAAFDAWWLIAHRKIGKGSARRAYIRAVVRLAAENKWEESRAIDYLVDRMETFAASPAGKSDEAGHPSSWLSEARYAEDDATWQQMELA